MNLIAVACDERELPSLLEWLRREPALRGQVQESPDPAAPATLGAASTAAIALATSGTLAALAASLSTWLTQRRSDVTVRLSRAGREVVVDAKRVRGPDELLTLLRALADEESGDQPP